MWTAEEFDAVRDDLRRWSLRMLRGAGLIGLAAVVACYLLASPFRADVNAFFGGRDRETIIPVSVFAGVIAFYTAIFLLLRSKNGRIRCPHCNGAIGQVTGLVVATGNCPHCGRGVLVGPPMDAQAKEGVVSG